MTTMLWKKHNFKILCICSEWLIFDCLVKSHWKRRRSVCPANKVSKTIQNPYRHNGLSSCFPYETMAIWTRFLVNPPWIQAGNPWVSMARSSGCTTTDCLSRRVESQRRRFSIGSGDGKGLVIYNPNNMNRYPIIFQKTYNLPSGKHTKNYWTWPFSSWIFPLKMVICHGYVNVYQRVTEKIPNLAIPCHSWVWQKKLSLTEFSEKMRCTLEMHPPHQAP